MAKVNLSVSVKDDHMPKFTEFVNELKKTGFDVDQELASAGVVTGSIDDHKLHVLKNLTGVAHVEESRDIKIPSPESEIQ